jgi:hypothetical protein
MKSITSVSRLSFLLPIKDTAQSEAVNILEFPFLIPLGAFIYVL